MSHGNALAWRRFLGRAAMLSVVVMAHAAAQAADVVFGAGEAMVPCTPHYVVDENGTLDLDAVRALTESDWTHARRPVVNLGVLDAPVWLRLTVRNEMPGARLVLEYTNPRTTYVDFYRPTDEGTYAIHRAGPGYRSHNGRQTSLLQMNPAFDLRLPAGAVETYYLRLENTGIMRFNLRVWTQEAFARQMGYAGLGNIAVFGMLLALVIYQVLIFLSLREYGYLYLGMFVLSFMFVHLSATGIGTMFFWSHSPWLNDRGSAFFVTLTLTLAAVFVTTMNHRAGSGLMLALGGVLVFFGLVAMPVLSFADTIYRLYPTLALGICVPVYTLGTGLFCWRRRVPFALLFLLAWGSISLVCLFVTLTQLRILQVFPLSGEVTFSLAFVGCVFLWSFALIGRVKAREQEMRRTLETQVQQRTAQLEQSLSQVRTLRGLLPICARCKKIRDDKGYWNSVESYVHQHTEAQFSHSICPVCMEKLYPEYTGHEEPNPGPTT
ncbi:MAG: 7TM diverse intracellular signaling domain-containing protein [Candidatus Hydrogenedentota bacterium]